MHFCAGRCGGRLCKDNDKVANKPVKVVLVCVPLRAMAVGYIGICVDDGHSAEGKCSKKRRRVARITDDLCVVYRIVGAADEVCVPEGK